MSIVASVGHSEWCAAGRVRLDLGTGRYTLTAPSTWRTCRRPAFRAAVRRGVLASGDLLTVRAAWRRVDAEGMADRTCGRRGQGQRIVISNGGVSMLRVMRGARTLAPPREEGCWSDAALELHRILESVFDPRQGR